MQIFNSVVGNDSRTLTEDEMPESFFIDEFRKATTEEESWDTVHREAYEQAKQLAIEEADALDRKSEAVANFVFPGLDESRKKLVGLYGREGLNQLRNQLKNHHDKINNMIATEILGLKKYNEELININESTKNITGGILKKENLKYFSTKFYHAYMDIESNLFVGGPNKNKESRHSIEPPLISILLHHSS
jgi:hypothetical protein